LIFGREVNVGLKGVSASCPITTRSAETIRELTMGELGPNTEKIKRARGREGEWLPFQRDGWEMKREKVKLRG